MEEVQEELSHHTTSGKPRQGQPWLCLIYGRVKMLHHLPNEQLITETGKILGLVWISELIEVRPKGLLDQEGDFLVRHWGSAEPKAPTGSKPGR
jgi:hypothetical protein